tara:strand:- start:1291 stop:1476 length:186 start_codon:yes stop_codon:yes gene_type:complete
MSAWIFIKNHLVRIAKLNSLTDLTKYIVVENARTILNIALGEHSKKTFVKNAVLYQSTDAN